MSLISRKLIGFLAATSILGTISLRAVTMVSVQQTDVGANEIVYVSSSGAAFVGFSWEVYAGVLKLDVNGVPTDGFCIDPWHWAASGLLTYNVESLASAPKSATDDSTLNPMGAAAAKQIEQLWAKYYSPGIDNVTAAAMQIKIWEIVDKAVTNGTFSLDYIGDGSDPTADGVLAVQVNTALSQMDSFLSTFPGAPTAHLEALTNSLGQDYVVSVPETGATAVLLGVAFAGLCVSRRRLQIR